MAWFAAVVFVAIFGFGEFTRWVVDARSGSSWWGIDLHLLLDASARLTSGSALYADPRFLYPPVAALLGVPFAALSFEATSLGLAGLKIAIVVGGVLAFTPGWSKASRTMAAVAMLGSLPFLHDLMLGNVNTLLVGAIAPTLLGRPRARAGILLGLATAAFAKPLLIPVLLWLLVWRTRVFVATVVTGVAATAAGLAVAGSARYGDWISALLGGTRYASPFAGNHGVSALIPELWLPVAGLTAAGLLYVLARRGRVAGLVWGMTSGLLIAPYAGTYSALPIALSLPSLAPLAPRLTLAIVALSPIAVTHPLPVYAAGILLSTVALAELHEIVPPIRRRLPSRTQAGP